MFINYRIYLYKYSFYVIMFSVSDDYYHSDLHNIGVVFYGNYQNSDKGNLIISHEAISSIAINAAKDVDGVGSFPTDP